MLRQNPRPGVEPHGGDPRGEGAGAEQPRQRHEARPAPATAEAVHGDERQGRTSED